MKKEQQGSDPESSISENPTGVTEPEDFLCLHIGLPRTGTKSLQWKLFSEHPDLLYLGLFSGKLRATKGRRPHAWLDPSITLLLNDILGQFLFSPTVDLDAGREVVRDVLERAQKANQRPLLSWEDLCIDMPRVRRVRAEVIWRLLGNRVRILMVLRSPAKLIASAYGLAFRTKNTQLLDDRVWLQPVDQWFSDSLEAETSGYMRYAETARMYVDLFGRENLKLLLFEDYLSDPASFADEVCDHFGIRRLHGRFTESGSANDSPKHWQHQALRLIARTPLLERTYRRVPPRVRWRLTKPYGFGRRAAVSLSPSTLRHIEDLTRAGNRWLQKEFDLDLEGKGYAL